MILLPIAAIICAAFTVAWIVKAHNVLAEGQVRVENSWSEITVQIARRHELILNLVKLAKGYVEDERLTLEKVIRARSGAINANQVGDQLRAEEELETSARHLFGIVEAYPQLKSNSHYQELLQQWERSENAITSARSTFNNNVASYNTNVRSIPTNFVAAMFGFREARFLSLDSAQDSTSNS